MSLRQEVLIAFSKTPHPGDESLTSCGCDECQREVGRFKGKKWSRLSIDDVVTDNGDANVNFLTPAAFHYFLPGLILISLDHPEVSERILDTIVLRLVVADRESEDRQKGVEETIKRLTARQKHLLIAVIQQAEDVEPHVPEIWLSAITNLRDGVITPYSQDVVERWLAEKFGGKSDLLLRPDGSGAPNPASS